MSRIGIWTAVTVLALLIAGCNEDETTASQGEGVVSGLVTDAATQITLPGVTVQAVDLANETVSTTTATGRCCVVYQTNSSRSPTINRLNTP